MLVFAGACSPPPAPQVVSDAAPAVDQSLPDTAPLPDSPPSRPDGRPNLGSTCSADHHCSEGLHCDRSLPDGLCTRTCQTDPECGGGRWGCHDGICLQRCNPRAIIDPCRERYVCRIEGPRALCVADCREVTCKTGWFCESQSGLCVDTSAGTMGAPCGKELGNCDGTPNGVCYSLDPLSGKGFCTIPCAPFTKPCPVQLKTAACVLGRAEAPFCAFLCNPKAPSCPHPQLSCLSLSKEIHVCLP